MEAATRPQYRPSLSLEELQRLVSFIPHTDPLYAKLYIYLAKANIGLNAAAYTASPKETVASRLGLDLGQSAAMAAATRVNSPAAGTVEAGMERAAAYTARLQQRAALAPSTLSDEDRYNLLAAKCFSTPALMTTEELEEGAALENKLYGLDMGTFSSRE